MLVRARSSMRVLVDELEPPEHVAAEMRVVEDLDVERLGAALEQQLEQLRRVRLPRRILLAFAGDADEDGVPGVAGHVEVVRVGAVVEQQPRDWQTPFSMVGGCVKRV